MPFKKVGSDLYKSPSGKLLSYRQVKAYYTKKNTQEKEKQQLEAKKKIVTSLKHLQQFYITERAKEITKQKEKKTKAIIREHKRIKKRKIIQVKKHYRKLKGKQIKQPKTIIIKPKTLYKTYMHKRSTRPYWWLKKKDNLKNPYR